MKRQRAFPPFPRVCSTIETKLTFFENQPLTSTSKRPVVVIKSQTIKNIKREGKKPDRPVKIGSPSIPAPMQLPVIRRIPPIRLPDFLLIGKPSCLHFLYNSNFLTKSSKFITFIVNKFKETIKCRENLDDLLCHFLRYIAIHGMPCRRRS